jgi:hypothetical protein
MRKLSILLAILVLFVFTGTVSAEIWEGQIESATTAIDKNGKEYVRLIVPVKKHEEGVNYTITIPAMAFDAQLLDYAKTLKAGDTVKFAASKRVYQGRESFTIHKFVE